MVPGSSLSSFWGYFMAANAPRAFLSHLSFPRGEVRKLLGHVLGDKPGFAFPSHAARDAEPCKPRAGHGTLRKEPTVTVLLPRRGSRSWCVPAARCLSFTPLTGWLLG